VTRGTRLKKPSSSRGFARKACGARGVWGFWGLKTKNQKFLSFEAGNNYQKNKYIYIFFFSRARGRSPTADCVRGGGRRGGEGRGGEGGGGRECVFLSRRPCPRGRVLLPARARLHGRVVASAQMQLFARTRSAVHADARVCLRGRAMSARTCCCIRADASVLSPGNFITDATVRPSHERPSGHRPIIRPSVCPLSSA
jgi:hypothetical protein